MELLEQHFDAAFAAPDGVKKLRELILTLAMQGRLAQQDPNDQPASELLKEIEAEKQRLVKEGKIKAPKPLPAIKPEEVPYELPQGWEWVRLNEFGIWKSGSTPSRQNKAYYGGDIPWVKSGEVKQGRIQETEEKISQKAFDSCSLHLNPVGSVLIAMYGANIGDTGILEIEATTNQAVCACRPYSGISNDFLLQLLVSLKQSFIAQGAGAAQPNISREKIIHTVVPLPPHPEQHRIVAKIDQMMARCDELEKLRAERERLRLTVHAAALSRVLAYNGETSSDAWRFITRHFGELYAVKPNVAELRKAILQLAVMGKLVPQDPNDPPASELLREIEAEKQRLVKEGKIKAPKPLPTIKPEEVPYELPQGWEWVRLGELIELVSGQHLTPSEYNDEKIGFSYYTGPADFGAKSPIATRWTTIDRAIAIEGDILLTVKGAGVGKTNVLAERKAAISRQLMALRVILVNRDFVLRFLGAIFYELQALAIGIAVPGIGRDDVLLRKFPLPPLPEQHRIVTKIDQLMALCDTLEQQIDAATGKRTELLSALMAQV
jgi:type I restriction enzyme S subunit